MRIADDERNAMRRETSEWTVMMLDNFRKRINLDAEYQRGIVWSIPQQQLLIDSIFRGFDLPKIFLRKLPDGSQYLFDVIDGVQRLTAIWEFLSDQFPLLWSEEYPTDDVIGGKLWSELPQDAKDRLQFAKVTITEIETDNDDEIRELFQRLQKGEPLNAAEKRNAMDTTVRHFVANKLAGHPLWSETKITNRRHSLDEMSAIILALVRADGPTGIKGADLLALYEDTEFDPFGNVATQTISLFKQMYEVAMVDSGKLRTRWGVVDLVLALMKLKKQAVKPDPEVVMKFFSTFEDERRQATAAISDLQSTVIELTAAREVDEEERKLELPEIQPDMLIYVNAFTREGATKSNIAARAQVMLTRLDKYIQDNRL